MYLVRFLANFGGFDMFLWISRIYLKFTAPRPREISEALKCTVNASTYCIMISGVRFQVWDLDPKTLPVIHVTPHYKRRKICIHREKLSNQAFQLGCAGSVWTLMSVFNAQIVNNGSCCISPRISDQSSANDNTQRLATTETTEQHGNFNLFHFQNNQMWPVNSQISLDIVCWPAVI